MAEDRRPDFEKMSDQELADWVHSNTDALGIDVAQGTTITATGQHIGLSKFGYVVCENSACGGYAPVFGDYLNGKIRLFNHAFEARHRTLTLNGDAGIKFLNVNVSRVENAVLNYGHEAAHSVGIDSYGGVARSYHLNAELRGYEALQRFRGMYGN